MPDHDRPLTVTPDAIVRRITEDQMAALRESRDNLRACVGVLRGQVEELDDCLAKIAAQVVSERTE